MGSIRKKLRNRGSKSKASSDSAEKEKGRESPDEQSEEEEEDLEGQRGSVPVGNPPLALGSGVLGALLTLYNSDQRSGFSTPGDRTPSGSEPPTPTHEKFDKGKEKERHDYFGRHAKSRERKERRDAERGRLLDSLLEI